MFVVARCDGTVMLDTIEEPLDLVAKCVDARAEGRRIDTMAERTDIGVGAAFGNLRPQRIAVVAAIGQQNAIRAECSEHLGTDRAVVRLSFGQLERDREAVAVNNRMDLGRKPATGTAHATTSTAFFSPFAAY